ncbi:MAG: mechanosensitive ion channel [Candidatus Methanofastidiosum sp.]|nr:mechanosensitive ion channel [Methanofastidiosum sp.]
MKKIFYFILFVIIFLSLLFYLIDYTNIILNKIYYSFLTITLTYLIFKYFFQDNISNKIKDSKTRYSFKKTIYVLYIILTATIIIRIWVQDTQTLVISYGLFAAGVAISLQEFFKNFVGGIVLFVTREYSVGDRIEIKGKYGDVIDIGILNTTLLEIREWVSSDQPTGRLSIIPNGQILYATVNNYTKDNKYIWDEIEIPISYESNWEKAIILIEGIVKEYTKEIVINAEKEISELSNKYYLSNKAVVPEVYISLTDNWINFNVRYIVEVRERRKVYSDLSKLFLKAIQSSEDINIASETLKVS